VPSSLDQPLDGSRLASREFTLNALLRSALDRNVLPVIDSQQVLGDSADESETAFFRDLWVARFGRREVEHSNSLPLRKVL
jgi:hypothetical protein